MERGDYEVFVKLNGNFDKAIMELRDQHIREVQDLRKLYCGAVQRIYELEAEVRRLKGIEPKIDFVRPMSCR